MSNYDRMIIKRIAAALLCAFIFVSFMPDTAYSLNETQDMPEIAVDDSDFASVDQEDEILSDELADDNSLLEGYMDSRLNEELGRPKPGSGMLKAAVSKRRNRLNENEKYIYDALREFMYKAAEGQESTAAAHIDLSAIFGPYYVSSGNYYAVTSESLGISSPVYVKTTVDGYTKWTYSDEAKEKLYDFSEIINALMTDEPYAFYWYDKTEGLTFVLDGMFIHSSQESSDIYFSKATAPVLQVTFSVAANYRPEGGVWYALDPVKTGATSSAIENAASIIEAYDSAPDEEKLEAYRDEICNLTSYNREAIITPGYPYGDPWQMIYVFDGNSKTNVVCEGYSKAFQYLCDHTYFVYDIECDSVTGTMVGGTGAGGHMWNILHMNDGRNYIADITNSDTGTAGREGGLFLSPAMAGGSVAGGYRYDVYHGGQKDGVADLTYAYDEDTLSIFSEDELVMSETEYELPPVMTDISYEWSEDNSSCTARGTWIDSGESVEETAAVTASVKIPPSCFTDGTTAYIAKFSNRYFRTQEKDVVDIPAFGDHRWDGGTVTVPAGEGSEGVLTYTCTGCGATRTAVIPAIVYPTDLPAVKISKPKAGKKKVTVKWKKVSKKNQKKIQGIEIQIAADPGFTDIVKTTTGSKKKTSKAVKGLKSKTTYYIRIRAYMNAADGKHVSYWKTKTVKIK